MAPAKEKREIQKHTVEMELLALQKKTEIARAEAELALAAAKEERHKLKMKIMQVQLRTEIAKAESEEARAKHEKNLEKLSELELQQQLSKISGEK